jgi:glutamate dehydrogenase
MCRPERANVPIGARERADRRAGDGMVDAVARRDDVMAQICELVSTSDPAGADAFVRSYYGQLGDDDLATWTTEELATAALEHWRFGARRGRTEALVRVYAPARGHTAVDVVLDDMPFLVDSLTMALDRRNLGVHLVVHPILRVRRSEAGELLGMAPDGQPAVDDEQSVLESWTHIEIDRETNAEILESVRTDLLSVLHDVRAATSDWKEMLETLDQVAAELDRTPPPCAHEELSEGKALPQ